jgi:hypothetical protein
MSVHILPNFGDERAVEKAGHKVVAPEHPALAGTAKKCVPVLVAGLPNFGEDHRNTARPRCRCSSRPTAATIASAARCRVQQPEAVRHQVLADDAAHRVARLAAVREDLAVSPAVCRVVQAACATCAWAPSARGRRRSTRCATARSCSRRRASRRADRPLRDLRPHRTLKDNDSAEAQSKLAEIKGYVSTGGVPEASLLKMAKLGAVIDAWMKEMDLDASACSAGRRWKSTSASCPAR